MLFWTDFAALGCIACCIHEPGPGDPGRDPLAWDLPVYIGGMVKVSVWYKLGNSTALKFLQHMMWLEQSFRTQFLDSRRYFSVFCAS
jgi:hypothetical protein